MALWVDDQMAFAASTVAAGNAAMGAWTRMSAWSAAQLSDGEVPKALAQSMANPRELAALLRVGLLEDRSHVYVIVDHLVLNPSRERALAKQATRTASATTAALTRWRKRGTDAQTHAQPDADGVRGECVDASPTHAPLPVPSHPIPEAPSVLRLTAAGPSHGSGKSRKKAQTAAPPIDASPEEVDRWLAKCAIPSTDPAMRKFLNNARAKDLRYADWTSAWRTWKDRESEFTRPPRNNGHQAAPPGGSQWESALDDGTGEPS